MTDDDALRADLQALYADLDARIAAANPRCDASGRCCRFAEWGHALFLSAPEAEFLFSEPFSPGGAVSAARCPYQVGGRCEARERRPTGCRVYFCDPAWQEKMTEVMEDAVRALHALHERHGRAWDYRPLHRFDPLAAALAQCPLPPAAASLTVVKRP